MAARKVDLARMRALEHAERWVHNCEASIPAGMGKGRSGFSAAAGKWMAAHAPPGTLENPQRAEAQLGSLGSGNHFIELAAD